jgi:general secretion pathway protein G
VFLGIFALLLYAMVVPKISHGGAPRSRIVAAASDIHGGIKTALNRYKIDANFYPKSLNDLIQQPSGSTNWHGPYIESVPIDPWGDEYIYEFPGKHNPSSYDLLSAGPDGKEGTSDDIGNW